ncbi:MAG: deoxynucleoside kinase [Chloroflexi bacterium]|nr:deoxynucleoside kinase [Chloroflexota bacterium]
MNRLIVIVGASGVGKTTLARTLGKKGNFATAFEQHTERPFQALFKQDAKYALANQMDYLLYRAEQERELRQSDLPALMDGGLDLDFHGFTHLFHTRGLLNNAEYDLCRRFYFHTRNLLPPPDLIIALSADSQTISERLAARNRINIASSEDAGLLEGYVNEWLESIPESNILKLNVSRENAEYSHSLPIILDKILLPYIFLAKKP